MIYLFLLLLLSCDVVASENSIKPNETPTNIDQEISNLYLSIDTLNKKIDSSNKISSKLVEDSHVFLKSLKDSTERQNKNQMTLKKTMDDIKLVDAKKTDLNFSIATDVPYVITVSLSILASVLITWLLLKRDSNISHNRLVKEFRQKWVNDFRDTISAYVDTLNQIESFQTNNIRFYHSRNIMMRLRIEYDKDVLKIDKRTQSRKYKKSKIQDKFKLDQEFLNDTLDEETEHYKLKNIEYLKLLSNAKVSESKLQLLLKPEFSDNDKLDKAVFNSLREIKECVHNVQNRHGVINHEKLMILSEALLKDTQHLLKSEWDRIKESKESKDSSTEKSFFTNVYESFIKKGAV